MKYCTFIFNFIFIFIFFSKKKKQYFIVHLKQVSESSSGGASPLLALCVRGGGLLSWNMLVFGCAGSWPRKEQPTSLPSRLSRSCAAPPRILPIFYSSLAQSPRSLTPPLCVISANTPPLPTIQMHNFLLVELFLVFIFCLLSTMQMYKWIRFERTPRCLSTYTQQTHWKGLLLMTISTLLYCSSTLRVDDVFFFWWMLIVYGHELPSL